MRRILTYVFALLLFVACIFNEEILPNNISDKFLGAVKRNVKKDRVELLEDMKEITRQGLVYFEVYDESGTLITVLKTPADFEQDEIQTIDYKNFSIKSVTKNSILGNIQLPNSLH